MSYIFGNTIRLTGTFRAFENNELADPENLTFKAFNPIRQELIQTCPIVRDSIGTYHVDYTIPDVPFDFIVVEFVGTVEDTQARVAKQIPVSWI